MNKKAKNILLFGILVLIVAGFSLTPLFGDEFIWNKDKNKAVPFNGLYFDVPTNISNFKVLRSKIDSSGRELIAYDVEFQYTGEDSSLRIIGKLAEQAFFGDGVNPKHSKATLKGEYDQVNNTLFNEKLKYRDIYKKVDDYKFTSISEIRVPLSEEIRDYKFRISYEPRKVVYSLLDDFGNVSVFLTNARVDKFTDSEYEGNYYAQSFNEGMYVNSLELYNESKINRNSLGYNINNVIFILSAIVLLLLIWFDKVDNSIFAIIPMSIFALTFYRFFEIGVSTKGALISFPILGFLSVFVGKQMGKDELKVGKYDLTQSLGGAIILFVLGVLIYVVPKTF